MLMPHFAKTYCTKTIAGLKTSLIMSSSMDNPSNTMNFTCICDLIERIRR